MSPEKTQEAAGGSTASRILLFLLADEQYGFALDQVEEVFELGCAPSSVIGAPDWLSGVINHHGQVVPVVDLTGLLGLSGARRGQQALLIQVAGQRLALAVDQIAGIESVTNAPGDSLAPDRAWHRGRLLTLLRPASIERALDGRLTRRRST